MYISILKPKSTFLSWIHYISFLYYKKVIMYIFFLNFKNLTLWKVLEQNISIEGVFFSFLEVFLNPWLLFCPTATAATALPSFAAQNANLFSFEKTIIVPQDWNKNQFLFV